LKIKDWFAELLSFMSIFSSNFKSSLSYAECLRSDSNSGVIKSLHGKSKTCSNFTNSAIIANFNII